MAASEQTIGDIQARYQRLAAMGAEQMAPSTMADFQQQIGYMPPSTEDWLKKNGLWLGLGAVALVVAYLYFKKQNEQRAAAAPVASNPRRRRQKRSRSR